MVELPEDLHSEGMPDNASRVAFSMGRCCWPGSWVLREPDPVSGIPVLVSSSPIRTGGCGGYGTSAGYAGIPDGGCRPAGRYYADPLQPDRE